MNKSMEIQKQERIQSVVTSTSLPSPTSSPSHEFSFAISLQNSSTAKQTPAAEKSAQQPSVIDLSPADDIFFHGHLLPLHFLSHLHAATPRSSTNSYDGFTLTKNLEENQKPISTNDEEDLNDCISYSNADFDFIHQETGIGNVPRIKERSNKHNPFSLFGLAKWRKPSDSNKHQYENENLNQENKKKVKFDISQFVKRYIKMVKPLLTSKGDKIRVRRQSYSFSGVLSPRDKSKIRGRRGEFSAPASMRTSPTNSGLLLATAGVPSPASDSTMEELQAAIQAAIAHCKSSISTEVNKPQELVPAT